MAEDKFFLPLLQSKDFIKSITELLLKSHRKLSEDEKQLWEEMFYARTSTYEGLYHVMLSNYWGDQERQILANMKSVKFVKSENMDFWLLNEEEWNKELEERDQMVIEDIVQKEGNAIIGFLALLAVLPQGRPSFDVTSPEILRGIIANSVKLAQSVNETTNNMLRKALMNGVQNGGSINDLRKIVKDLYAKWKTKNIKGMGRAQIISRTEVGRASGKAATIAFKISGVVVKKEWRTTKDDRTCTFCSAMDGVIVDVEEHFFEKGDELTVDDAVLSFDYNNIEGGALHPNCFFNENYLIYTDKGYIDFKRLKVGNLVFTHKGRFRKILKIHKNSVKKNFAVYGVDIFLEDMFQDACQVIVTPEHPLLRKGIWTKAQDLKKGDKITVMYSPYKFYDVPIKSIHIGKHSNAKNLYNLTVEEDESFILEGVVVHNCRCCIVPVISPIYVND